MADNASAMGIDIGGTGIKGALVDLSTGALLSDRIKIPTPEGASPKAIIEVVVEIVRQLEEFDPSAPVGVCFPAIVKEGRTLSAANVSDEWIGLEAEKLFERAIGHDIHFVNDADAAGYAEARFGAAKNQPGTVLMTTLGTGIGTALIHNGILIPNMEFGHLEVDGANAESRASNAAREREELSWEDWARRLERYYSHVEFLLSPDLIVVGGGVSKSAEKFLPLIKISTPIIPAIFRNNAGILGAAAQATRPAAYEVHTTQ